MAQRLSDALKLLREVDEESKHEALIQLKDILDEDFESLVPLGHDLVIYKRLENVITFESKSTLNLALDILQIHFFKNSKLWDDMAELLIMRVVRSIDYDTSRACLEKLSILIDYLGEDTAKHSKQITKMIDLNSMPSLNDLLVQILNKLKNVLPTRKVSDV